MTILFRFEVLIYHLVYHGILVYLYCTHTYLRFTSCFLHSVFHMAGLGKGLDDFTRLTPAAWSSVALQMGCHNAFGKPWGDGVRFQVENEVTETNKITLGSRGKLYQDFVGF